MNLSQIQNTPKRLLRPALALAGLTLMATSLTACASDTDSTTCGEVNGMSDDELTDFAKKAFDEDATDEEKAQVEALGDQAYAIVGQTFKAACVGQDDDKKLGDIDEEDINIDNVELPTPTP